MRVSGEIPGLIVCKTTEPYRGRLVGRSSELARLCAPVPAATILLGEPGAGKSRLLAEVASGWIPGRAVSVSCHVPGATIPLEPLSAVEQALRRRRGRQHAAHQRQPMHSEADRLVSIREGLEAAAVNGPLLVQIDDVQWADAPTTDAIVYLVDRLRDYHIRWHFAGRSGETQCERLAISLTRLSVGEVVRLSDFPFADYNILVETLSRTAVQRTDVGVLLAITGGNPLYTEQWLAAQDAGLATHGLGLRMLLEDRIRALALPSRAFAEALAVHDGSATANSIAATSGLSADKASCAAFELESMLVIRRTADGFTFRHDLLRETCYCLIPESERRSLHNALADRETDPWRKFFHLRAAGRGEEAVRLIFAHGFLCLDSANPTEASAAFRCAEETSGSTVDQHNEAQLGIVAARAQLGEFEPALKFLGSNPAAKSQTEALPRLLGITRIIEAIFEGCDDCATIVPHVHKALFDAARFAPALIPRLSSLSGAVSCRGGKTAEAQAQLTQGLVRCDDNTPLRDVVHLQSWLGIAHALLGDTSTGLRETIGAAVSAEAGGLSAEFAKCCLRVCYVADLAGDDQAYHDWCRRGLDSSGPMPLRVKAVLRLNLATSALARGELHRGLELAAAVVNETACSHPALRAQALSAFGLANAMTGRNADAATATAEMDRLNLPTTWRRAVQYVTGRIFELQGDDETALSCYRIAYALAQSCATKEAFDVRATVGEIRVLFRLRRFEEVRMAMDRIERFPLPVWPIAASFHDEARGFARLSYGDVDWGSKLLLAAATASRERFRATTLHGYAAVAMADRQGINNAIAEFDAMGAPVAADDLRVAANRIGFRPRSRPRKTGELTESEGRVAIFVGAGKTNLEIAAQLGLSGKTVEHYVSNILAKRGLRSRAQIAALVAAGSLMSERVQSAAAQSTA